MAITFGENRGKELIEIPGFRVALRLPGMTKTGCKKKFARG
jgi:hypothetical protein